VPRHRLAHRAAVVGEFCRHVDDTSDSFTSRSTPTTLTPSLLNRRSAVSRIRARAADGFLAARAAPLGVPSPVIDESMPVATCVSHFRGANFRSGR
jgi:hypothetical protein